MIDIEKIKILKGAVEEAIYKEQEIQEYACNPFIEALPEIFTEEDVVDRFTVLPEISEKERNKADNLRYHIIKRAKNFIQPLPIHIKLERKISSLIRRGYLSRNPIDKKFLENLRILNGLDDNLIGDNGARDELGNIRSTADSLSIIGISGIGKTTAIDDILGTRYLEKFGYSNRITSTMLINMTKLAWRYGIGILAIDEIHHLLNTKNGLYLFLIHVFTATA